MNLPSFTGKKDVHAQNMASRKQPKFIESVFMVIFTLVAVAL